VKPHDREITGIASVSNAAIINVEGGGMMGVPGIASKVFSALARVRTNVIMISQASSEHSICLVLKEEESERARQSLLEALAYEISAKLIQSVEIRRNLEIIAVIGENMQGTPGLAGRVFSALGDAGINVLAIAQGSSELNISLVIESADTSRALNAIHKAFLNGKRRP
jgi:aspartokinase/homoserine dehydrogenase 1